MVRIFKTLPFLKRESVFEFSNISSVISFDIEKYQKGPLNRKYTRKKL